MEEQVSMNQAFISKLYDIMEENFHNSNFGVRELAKSAGVSRSKLHRKLKQIKGQSASEFIKLFRLQKAYPLLEKDVSTVSEIAYTVGFNSPSYFSKCFNEYYNCSPGELKHKDSETKKDLLLKAQDSRSTRFFVGKSALILLGILALVIFSFLVFKIAGNGSEKSEVVVLAVLPFKNLSEDPSNQYFADGVMEVILNHLSQAENINVLSRTTMDQYRETDKTVPEIARELNLTHVIEASIQRDLNRVRVVVQLIDAKNDSHLWAESYDRTYEDIFGLQSDIAKEVAQNLQKNLTPSNLAKMEEVPTESIEAYNLYLKGRFFWQRRQQEELKKSVHYFEQAIQLDSTFALAYAGLADVYHIMGWYAWYDREQDIAKAREFAKKAISLDPDLSSAYSVLGSLSMWFDRDFEKAEKEFQLGLDGDANDGTGHQYYAELLNVLGRKKEAREQIDLALKSNPNSSVINSVSANIYYNNYEFGSALEALQKAYEISGFKWHMMYALVYIKLGEDQKAVDHLITELTFLPGFERNDSEIKSVYQEYGINGIIEYYIENRLKFDEYKNYHLYIPLSCIMGEPQKALDFLEKSFGAGDITLIANMHHIDLQCIQGEPEYKSILKKIKFPVGYLRFSIAFVFNLNEQSHVS